MPYKSSYLILTGQQLAASMGWNKKSTEYSFLTERNIFVWEVVATYTIAGLILGLRPANERRRYFVTTSLIGLAQA